MSEEKRIFHPSVFSSIAASFHPFSPEEDMLISSVFNDILYAIDNSVSLDMGSCGGLVSPLMDAGYIRDYCAVRLYGGTVLSGYTSEIRLDPARFNPDDFLQTSLNAFFNEYPGRLSFSSGHFFIEPDSSSKCTVRDIPLWSVDYLMNGECSELSTFLKDVVDVWKRKNHITRLSYTNSNKCQDSLKPAFGLPCKCTDAVFERKPADRSRNRSFEYSR